MDSDIAGSSSLSEQSDTERKSTDDPPPPLSPNALKCAAADCLNSWIYYLQMLNTMCAAGLRLSQSLSNLSQLHNIPLSLQCHQSWDELAKSTMFASNTVKTHIAAAMQDLSIGDTFTESDAQRQMEHNQQIITENLLTFINLQYQFSIAGCECFGPMAMCPSCNATPGGTHNSDCTMGTMQQLFARMYQQDTRSQMSSPQLPAERGSLDSPKSAELYKEGARSSPLTEGRGSSPYQEPHRGQSPIHGFTDALRAPGPLETLKGPFPTPGALHTMKLPYPGRGSRSPLHFPLFPINCGRRWSEAGASDASTVSGKTEGAEGPMRRWSMDCASAEVTTLSHHKFFPSKLIVPVSNQSQERSRSTTPEAVPPPVSGTISSGDGIAEAIQLLSCRPTRQSIPQTVLPGHPGFIPPWAESHEERMQRRMYPGPASQRGNWQSIDVPHSGMSVADHFDIFPPGMSIISRKSSSSTDSSSCLSIHSRSTTSSSERGSSSDSSGEAIRLQSLYSMWSGNEHLPFIQLPESQEPQDDSDNDDAPPQKSGHGSS